MRGLREAAVKTFGPAYRYPAAGWIYLHIEGKPYERGYQHGHLMAARNPKYLDRCAADLGPDPRERHGRTGARTANALFLRGFDRGNSGRDEGIADGAADAGAKWQGRKLDLIDIVVANVTVELGELQLRADGDARPDWRASNFDPPAYYDAKRDIGSGPLQRVRGDRAGDARRARWWWRT